MTIAQGQTAANTSSIQARNLAKFAQSGCRGVDPARRALGPAIFTGFTRFADLYSACPAGRSIPRDRNIVHDRNRVW
jgi:hypothetical protein